MSTGRVHVDVGGGAVATVRVVSEYLYDESAAVGRPLDEWQLVEVRAQSTRAYITPTSFVERDRRAVPARRDRFAALTAEGDAAWARVATRIAENKPVGYDAAIDLLVDLRDVTGETEFSRRVEALRVEHWRKPGLTGRRAAPGL